jgi:hypothetical protein
MTGGEDSSSDAAFEPMTGGMRGTRDAPMRGAQQRTDNSYSVVEPEGSGEATRVAPTVAGALCRRLRAVGVMGANHNHPALLDALGEGISPEWIESVATELVSKGQGPPKLAYVVATVRGRAKDGKGQGDGTGAAAGGRSSSERAERACEWGDELARRRVGRLGVIDGGRAT